MVCTANVCRSPMAAALLARRCAGDGIDASVSSAGTDAVSLPVDPLAVDVMRGRGLDIASHVPRQLDAAMLAGDGADLVITMTRAHLRAVSLTRPGTFPRAFTAKELARRSMGLVPGADGGRGLPLLLERASVSRSAANLMGDHVDDDVDDPYGRSLPVHRRIADELESVMGSIARALRDWA